MPLTLVKLQLNGRAARVYAARGPVHRAEGRDRSGDCVATSPVVVENCTVDDAPHEMFDYRFNTIWFRNPASLRKLDVARMRELVQRAR